MMGYDQEPAYSPDGKWIAFLSMERAGFESDRSRVMLHDRKTGAITELTTGWDQSAHSITWSPDSAKLYVTSDTTSTTQIYELAAAGGEPRAITQGRYQFASPVVGPDSRRVYCLRQRTERPFEIVQLDPVATSVGTALTDVNGGVFAKLDLPKVEERWFDATDGKKIHSWVIYPPDFDPAKKWPMLLYCQGGPQSQVGQWFSYRWNFHLMAAQGYIVLAVNRRGLPGFSQAWNDEISRDWGGQAMRDLLSATDQMFAEPFVDRQHTGAIGASFGAYTIYWLMGHDQPNRFATMIAHDGIFNLESMYCSTEELFFVNWDLGGPYWKNPQIQRGYTEFSPHRFAGKWDTPLLVIHGGQDFRVPLEEGLQAFTAAQIQGVDSRFLYFPDEGHWVLSPQNGVVWHRVFFDWLGRYLQPAAVAVAPESGEHDGARKYLLERVDDTAIAQLYADGFEKLSLRDKMLSYHLVQAAIAGRDIFLDQKFAFSLQIRDVLEELYVHRRVLDAATRAEIERYTKLFWVHNGIHSGITTKKEILRLGAEQFRTAIAAAEADGAQFDLGATRLHDLFGVLSDPSSYVSVTNKSPGEGGDPLTESCNNLYVGVSTADLVEFDEQHPLNSRVMKMPDGRLVEQVYRAGDGAEIPPGLYAVQLNQVIRHLQAAIAYAPAETAAALRSLIRFYRTGAVEDWRAFNIAWVRDTDSVVDQINGFIEVYVDARGQKGSWEAVVSFLNPEQSAMIRALAREAQWFEDRMPWDAEFKKQNVKGISARVISVLTETGDSGPITPIGINLPNEVDIRQDYGSKSVSLGNVIKAYEEVARRLGVDLS